MIGQHADFTVASSAVTAFVIAGLIAWVLFDHAAQRRVLGDLEEHGITRRSRKDEA